MQPHAPVRLSESILVFFEYFKPDSRLGDTISKFSKLDNITHLLQSLGKSETRRTCGQPLVPINRGFGMGVPLAYLRQ